MTDVPKVMTPNNVVALRRKYGGIEATPVHESRAGMCVGIYGPGGIGKTTLAATIMDSELGSPALCIDARGNPHVVSSYGDKLDILTVKTFADVEKIRQGILKELRDEVFPYKSIIVDNLSELHAMDLRDRYGASATIEWTMHSGSTSDLLQLARNWSDLATVYGINVVFIAWDTPETRNIRGQEVSRSEMAFNKALQSQLPGIISWLGRLYIIDDRDFVRCLDFRPIESMHQAKFQVDPNNPYTRQIPMEIYSPSLASILDTVKGGKPWPTEKHAKPEGRFGKKRSDANNTATTSESEKE